MGNQDRGYRLLFQHPEMVEDLLRGFVHESWIDDLDFSTLQHLADIHVSDKLHQRETDMVWKLRYGDEEWFYVYILLEFQSTVDPFMALRLLVYVGLLLQRLQKQGDLIHGDRLPPVLPLVLYNGDQEWTAARDVSKLFAEAPSELARYRPRMPYLVIDEERLAEADLESLRNLAATLFRLERSRGPADMFQVMDALAEWLRDRDDLLRDFLAWISHVLLPRHEAAVGRNKEVLSLEELRTMLQERTQRTWSQIAYEEGQREGEERGKKEGHARMLQAQLEAKFGALDDSVRSRLHEANPEQLLRWGTRLLRAESLDDVFG